MKFDKNKDEAKNFQILIKEIKSKSEPYSKILLDTLSNSISADDFRNAIKEKVNEHIENKIQK